MKRIYLAGGCFWGVEHFFKQLHGVHNTEVGYANSHKEDPTYKEVCEGISDASETVLIDYLEEEIGLDEILNLYFKIIDPTSVNKQGEDTGPQYRTGIYYIDEEDLKIIQKAILKLQEDYDEPIAIEVLPLSNFYDAEAYHQDYLDKNPTGYCHLPKSAFKMSKDYHKNVTQD